ncbi:MAG: 2-oxoacid:acceptor oxidoreductase subunit alpha [Desulfobacterales bacterium]|nr:2-oxoacid:acceptor oxidoreductase subunit alpha [Desulfobacterales bacterium]
MEKENICLVQGNEACVKGAVRAGCRFFAGYPITPASEIAELMAREMPQCDGDFVQMEDEIGSISAIIGAAWGGRKTLTATSGPGFSLMQEGLGYAVETETPCVIINVMRGGPSTGQPTVSSQQDVMQARFGAHGDYEAIALCPSSVQECYELTVKAFNLAEKFRTPVVVLSDEIVGHTREILEIPREMEIRERQAPSQPPENYLPYQADDQGLLDGMPAFGQGYRCLVDGQLHDETGNRKGADTAISGALMRRLCEKISIPAREPGSELEDVRTEDTGDAEVLVLAYGSVARSALSAVRQARSRGIKAGFFQPRILWPFPEAALKKAAQGVKTILVPEMNMGKVDKEVQRICSGVALVSLARVGGELHTPEEILVEIESAAT